jgi:hypothetical protein
MIKTVFDAIREQAHSGWSDCDDFAPDLDADGFTPTNAMPGSAAKVATLEARAAAGLPLWHPQDRRHYDDGEPGRQLATSIGPPLARVTNGATSGVRRAGRGIGGRN